MLPPLIPATSVAATPLLLRSQWAPRLDSGLVTLRIDKRCG